MLLFKVAEHLSQVLYPNPKIKKIIIEQNSFQAQVYDMEVKKDQETHVLSS